jgi:hypothetical protein
MATMVAKGDPRTVYVTSETVALFILSLRLPRRYTKCLYNLHSNDSWQCRNKGLPLLLTLPVLLARISHIPVKEEGAGRPKRAWLLAGNVGKVVIVEPNVRMLW